MGTVYGPFLVETWAPVEAEGVTHARQCLKSSRSDDGLISYCVDFNPPSRVAHHYLTYWAMRRVDSVPAVSLTSLFSKYFKNPYFPYPKSVPPSITDCNFSNISILIKPVPKHPPWCVRHEIITNLKPHMSVGTYGFTLYSFVGGFAWVFVM